jgi:hypothetical protein
MESVIHRSRNSSEFDPLDEMDVGRYIISNHSFDIYEVNAMSIGELVSEKIRLLSPEKQQEVLDFVEFLAQPKTPPASRPRLKGVFADLNVHISDEDIAKARQEMWEGFPREDV